MNLPPSPDWMADALCAQVDPDAWFPDQGESPAAAKRICQACPVVTECRAYALADDTLQGVWGATSTRERARLRRTA